MNSTIPYERLLFFKEQIGFDERTQETLHASAELFVEQKDAFADYFEEYFNRHQQTQPFLEFQDYPGKMRKILSRWFADLFTMKVDQSFLLRMWHSGVTHVRINLDHRFVNLGYCLVGQFCRGIIDTRVQAEDRAGVSEAVEKILDLCLLIETDAFITNTFHCDSEVIKGISHQIRNPLMVIGGSVMRLKRGGAAIPVNTVESTYETILAESKRMERMMADVSSYNEVFHGFSKWEVFSLRQCLEEALKKCAARFAQTHLEVQVGFSSREIQAYGNPRETALLFTHLLENAYEAVDPDNPAITIQTSPEPGTPKFVLVEIFNTGGLPEGVETETLFTPFFSSKAMGTGLGLSIARLAAQKVRGSIDIRSAPQGGVIFLVTLPRGDAQ